MKGIVFSNISGFSNTRVELAIKGATIVPLDLTSWRSVVGTSVTWAGTVWAHELNMMVTVGSMNGGRVQVFRSKDGGTWESTIITGANARDITWSPTLRKFLIVGVDIMLMSSDAITWTTVPKISGSTSNYFYNKVIWAKELSKFVMIASGSAFKVYTSPDGINWEGQVTPSNNAVYSDLEWSKELNRLVAVASTGTTERIMYSPDGINWTATVGSLTSQLQSVVWSSKLGMFIAVGHGGGNIISSTNGITWTIRSTTSSTFSRVLWIPELSKFVAPQYNNASTMFHSSDGITWESINLTGNVNGAFTDINYSPWGNRIVGFASGGIMACDRPSTIQ